MSLVGFPATPDFFSSPDLPSTSDLPTKSWLLRADSDYKCTRLTLFLNHTVSDSSLTLIFQALLNNCLQFHMAALPACTDSAVDEKNHTQHKKVLMKDVAHEAAERGHLATDQYGHTLVDFDQAAESRLRLKIDLYIVPTVALMYLFCFIDRANIGESFELRKGFTCLSMRPSLAY